MEFKYMIVVLLANVVCGKMVVKKEFVKLDTQIKSQKTPSIMSIQSEDGDIIDCIDIYKQPAFDHPALKYHKIQMNPSYDVQTETTGDNKQLGTATGQTWQRSGSCPKGTIPIRRTPNNNFTKSNTYGKKKATPFHHERQLNDSKTLYLLQKNHSVAVLLTEGFAYYGAKGVIKVWNPRVEWDDEYSTSQVALKGGHYTEYEVMESGWAVNPSVYGDKQTRLFTYWTLDGGSKTGCFDITCPGFVQTSNEIALGAAIYPISNPTGLPYDITIYIHKDRKTNNWWVQYGERINIGYWPAEVLDKLKDHAEFVEWGGEVYSSRVGVRPHTATGMGSGEFPDPIMGTSGYVKRIRVLENSHILRFPRWVRSYSDEFNCYQTYYLTDYVADPEFYYGGPGSYRNPICR